MNPAPSGMPGTGLKKITLLVVEDEVLVRFSVADALRAEGYHVLEAATADEAMTLLESFPDVALLFTDIQMPGSMDGLQLADRLKTSHPDLPVIITSGTRPRPDATTPFFTKPYKPEQIISEVADLLKRRDPGPDSPPE